MLTDTLSALLSSTPVSIIPTLIAVLIIGQLFNTFSKLRGIPGPFWAKLTNLWRMRVVHKRDSHDTYLKLHEKYGDLVRIGPNCISINSPEAIPSIYGINIKAPKSDFYAVWQNIVNGKRTASLVFTTDEAQHAIMKRPIASAYSLSTLVEFEPLLDSTTAVFLSRLDDLFAGSGKVCDLGTWLQWYAFDVIGELTLSKRLGFLENARDVEDIAASIAANFDRCSVLGQMPWLDLWTYKNPIYRMFAKTSVNPVIAFGQRRLQERLEGGDEGNVPALDIKDETLSDKVLHGTLPSKPDFLSRFLQLHDEQPDVVTDRAILAYLFININAGSDTISSTLKAVFYYLLKHPASMNELTTELKSACEARNLTTPLPTWKEVQDLPYLQAVIKEALRLNPALALPLERVVPAAGLKIGETFIPPGTVVGINPWVFQRNRRIFGEDAGSWRPERWLSEDVDRVKYMDQHILTFGAGKRTCLGRNIAMLELAKVVPALLLRYKMELEDPEREWTVINSWAVRQEGLNVLLERR